MILLTGATGFLGRHIVDELLAEGYDLRLLIRDPQHRKLPWKAMVEIVEGNVLDIESIDRAMAGIETVIHAAAEVSYWKRRHTPMYQVNVQGTANLVNACLEHHTKKLIHLSSIASLGKKKGDDLINEETLWTKDKSHSYYALTKHKAEREVYRGIAEGLEAVIINPGVVIGPAHDWHKNTGKIFSIVDKGLKFANKGVSGFVGVKDVARMVSILLREEVINGSKYILVSENMSQKELLTRIADALDKPAPKYILPAWLTLLVGYLSQFWANLSGKEPIITPETMRSAISRSFYDGSKATQLGLTYTPMKEVIDHTAQAYTYSQELHNNTPTQI